MMPLIVHAWVQGASACNVSHMQVLFQLYWQTMATKPKPKPLVQAPVTQAQVVRGLRQATQA